MADGGAGLGQARIPGYKHRAWGGRNLGHVGTGARQAPPTGPAPASSLSELAATCGWAWPAVLGLLAPPTFLGAGTASRGRTGVGACSFGPQILAG